ncbi:hypothetical protein GCM10008107_26930 [Psychrosphaera saromensis]|uniref:CAAX prenyl protease 2/Lysostaphin resistance protein A-like domain-containing protein n=1 Tax=Psychrosphaera saromensis TaxID=716813 RepID=A0A2S7UVM4_9GAMM|nr:CPBP family intramembrane glutamic endopeptidase [Psychrosphaera saromensis]PQJ54007.1 hypothetical protein BTO11_10330 [Psychrosphaera saromensis]GHB76085.1 hypothetical protein GCM10008107_26930 [Psychrosphaera saromensis]GLQ14504.1 hypothetical protein GCM10007917_19590 [Psychrosphaera saromensis]
MIILEVALLSYFILYPIYIFLTHKAEKLRVLNQQESKVNVYLKTMLNLWIPVIILGILVVYDDISLIEIGLKWQWDITNSLALLSLILLAGYFLVSLKSLKNNSDEHSKLKEQYEFIRWFLPVTPRESKYFIFGLSITAGVCEEILFRGYVMHILSNDLPMYVVIIISSIIFGFGHIYQGASHVVRTAILGSIMAVIYLVTDSLVVPILLHLMLDMYGGAVAYIIFSDKKSEALMTK